MGEKNILGVDKDLVEKAKDILPTLDLGTLEVGEVVYLQVLSEEPKEVTHKNKFKKNKKDPDEITTKVINVFVEKIIRADEDKTEVTIGDKQALWLSSKSLALGISRVLEENEDKLLGLKLKIEIGKAIYKEFGENRCYNVSEY